MHHGHIIHTLCIMDTSVWVSRIIHTLCIMDTSVWVSCIIHTLCIMDASYTHYASWTLDTSVWVSRIIHTLCIMDASYTHYASWTHLRWSHGLSAKRPQTRSWGLEGPLNFWYTHKDSTNQGGQAHQSSEKHRQVRLFITTSSTKAR